MVLDEQVCEPSAMAEFRLRSYCGVNSERPRSTPHKTTTCSSPKAGPLTLDVSHGRGRLSSQAVPIKTSGYATHAAQHRAVRYMD